MTRKFAVYRASPAGIPWEVAESAGLQHVINLSVGDGEHFERRFTGLRWIRSYWEQDTGWGVCLFSGETREQIAAYQALCDSGYTEIVELDDEAVAMNGSCDYPSGWHVAADDAPLVAILGPTTDMERLCGGPLREAWIRTYLERGTGRAIASLRRERFGDEGRGLLAGSKCELHRIVELSPKNYTGQEL